MNAHDDHRETDANGRNDGAARDAEGSGGSGLPTNSAVPGGFELPLPVPVANDPWATAWETLDDDLQPSKDWPAEGWDQTDWSFDADIDSVGTGAGGQSGSGNSAGTSGYGFSDFTTEDQDYISSWRPAGYVEPEPSVSDADATTVFHRIQFPEAEQSYEEDLASTSAAAAAAAAAASTGANRSGSEGQQGGARDDEATTAASGAKARIERPGPSAEELISLRARGERERLKASGGLRRAFGMGPGARERTERDRIDRIARPVEGRRTIMVINTKGGGGKTLVTLMLATYLARYRSGSTLAWDNNETEGTLGMRAPHAPHHRTVVDLLNALPQISANNNAGPGELAHWVREQRGLSFDVLASADDDESMRVIGELEFEELHSQLARFYRMIVVDTGNNRLSPNWLAAAQHADQLVFATSLKDDTSVVAAKNLDALVAMGRHDLVQNAVCVISHTSARGDAGTGVHTREHFERWVREVVDIPFDPALTPGLQLDPRKINKRTHEACMEMAAAVVDGL